MKVVIAGSTGMIGSLVLQHCLQSPRITEVRSLVRRPTGEQHSKLVEITVANFKDYSPHSNVFIDVDCAFFCLGAYTGQVPDAELRKITVDYAVAFAKAVEQGSPGARFCLLSGAGADRTEKSRTPFALYKGMAENQIAAMQLKSFAFRPGYIYPVTPRKEPNIGYRIMRSLYPVMKLFGDRFSITSTDLANTMFHVGLQGADSDVLENKDILRYVNRGGL